MHYSLLAGQRALAAYAYEEALDHFERGLVSRGIALTGSQPASDEQAADLLFGLGSAQFATVERHRVPDAVACLGRAFDYYAEAGVVDRVVDIAQQPVSGITGLLSGATQLTRRALEMVQRGSHAEGRLLSQYSKAVYFEENDFEAAHDAYTRALVIAQREADIELELRTLANAAAVEIYHGMYQESLEKSLRGLELARHVDNPMSEFEVQLFAAGARLMMGDLKGAKPLLESSRDRAACLRDRDWLATALAASSMASICEGDWDGVAIFPTRAWQARPRDTRCLAVRLQLEFELGEFALTPPGPNTAYFAAALGMPLAARVTGAAARIGVSEAAADAVLATANTPTLVAWGARAGLGFTGMIPPPPQSTMLLLQPAGEQI